MANNPYISVVVPMYNVEKYIAMCIGSILAQTFQDFEIIVVDDASPDNSGEIVNELFGNNDKVRVIRHRKNRGLGPARNTGIENARGEYIYFVDSDDLILGNTLDKLAAAAKQTGADVIHMSSYCETTQDDQNPIDVSKLVLRSEAQSQQGFLDADVPTRIANCFIKSNSFVMTWLCMCKKDFLYKNDLEFQACISEDEPFFFDLICYAEKFYTISDALYVYRKRGGSIMLKHNFKRLDEGINAMAIVSRHLREVITKFEDKYPVFRDAAFKNNFIFEMLMRYFNNHVYPFYSGGGISAELDNVVEKALTPAFAQDTFFVKYLLHNYSNSRRANENLFRQLQITGNKIFTYAEFLQFCTTLDIKPNKIVLANFNGKGYGCNPKYIAEEIFRRNLPYDLVWLLNDINTPMPSKIRKVQLGTADAVRELSTAKIIISNVKNTLPFIKRQEQFFIMTWHAALGLKYVEKDAEDQLSPQYVAESKANSAITDLMIVDNQAAAEEIKRAFWYNGEILNSGLPRDDIFFKHDENLIAKTRASLNIPAENKIVMYAPTFRDNMYTPEFQANPSKYLDVYRFDSKKLISALKNKFGGEWTLLCRFHPNMSKMAVVNKVDFFKTSANVIDVTHYEDMQELLLIADVLVTDYSSTVYEFMIQHKPVFLLAKDVDIYPQKYRRLKPLYYELPYAINKTETELYDRIKNFDDATINEKVDALLKKLQIFDDGHASERLVDVIQSVIDSDDKLNLIHGGCGLPLRKLLTPIRIGKFIFTRKTGTENFWKICLCTGAAVRLLKFFGGVGYRAKTTRRRCQKSA